MTLKHDAAGFLIGDPLDLGRAVSLLETIRSDVRSMRQVVAGSAVATPRASTKADRAPVVAVPSRGHSAGAKAETVSAVNRQMAAMAKASRPAASPNGRDERCRFVSNGAGSPSSSPRINNQDADPTVKAFKEVSEPMKRGLKTIFGDRNEKQKTGWFRRIWGELKGIRTEQTVYEKAAAKTLKAIENKPGGAVAGNGSVLSGLLPSIPGAGSLLGGLGGLGGLLKGAAKGALRRLPLIGALLSGVGAAADIFGSENDDQLSRRQKDRNAGKAIGGAGGTIGGMMAGAAAGAFAGPIGMAIGGVVGGFLGDQAGQIIGEKFGSWVNDLREADIPEKVTAAWSGFVDFAKTSWADVTKAAGELWNNVKAGAGTVVDAAKGLGNKANQAVKDATGIDVKGAAQNAAAVVQQTGSKAIDAASQVAGQAGEAAKSGAAWLGKNTSIGKGASWLLGQTSKNFESGKGGAGTVSSGKGDAGGASYGTYQLSSKAGTLDKFLGSTKYGAEFSGLQPGTPEFKAKWKEVAASDQEFGTAQHDFIKATHFDPQMAKLQGAGLDLTGRGASVQDAVWSTAVQFGPNSSLIQKALKGKAVSSLSDKDIVSAIQDYKTANNDTLFKSSSADVRAGTLDRAMNEKSRLLALAEASSQATVAASPSPGSMGLTNAKPAQVATISMPSVPSMPAAPIIPSAPEIQIPLSSSDSGRGITVTVPTKDPGQDLENRRLAHIVTGGFSNA